MANFGPFGYGSNAEKRFPDATEAELGHPCGPASRALFTGLFYRLEAELRDLITYAGITPTDARFTQVREAVLALIAAATGGEPDADYVLMSQLRQRLMFFPEAQSADGRIVVTGSGGTVVVPTGVTILHRSVFPLQTGDVLLASRTFATNASSTYHLRANITGTVPVFSLNDLSNVGYNPSAAAETEPTFDSTYDDMLIARVVTNGSNVATITNLINRHKYYFRTQVLFPQGSTVNLGFDSAHNTQVVPSWNTARTPSIVVEHDDIETQMSNTLSPQQHADADVQVTWIGVQPTRYNGTLRVTRDYLQHATMVVHGNI